jgi:hypothetical protein
MRHATAREAGEARLWQEHPARTPMISSESTTAAC